MLVKLRQLKKKSQSLPHQWPTLFGVLLRQGQVASPDQPAKVCPLTSCFHKAVACHADLAQTKERFRSPGRCESAWAWRASTRWPCASASKSAYKRTIGHTCPALKPSVEPLRSQLICAWSGKVMTHTVKSWPSGLAFPIILRLSIA